MPELPEVETTRRGIEPHVRGQTIDRVVIRNGRLRWPVPNDLPSRLAGKQLLAVDRRGKYLLLRFQHGTAIWHLGMSGSLRLVTAADAPGKHDHVDWVFSGRHILRFNDPRRFGALLWTEAPPEEHFLLAHLGPEPLTDVFDGPLLFNLTRKRTQPIKTWLMDSRNLVGVGNIYANEALFSSAIHPRKLAGALSRRECNTLATELKNILEYAIRRGGTTLRDFVGGDGKPGYFAQELQVYGRGGEPCRKCRKLLTEKRLGQRTTVYCTHCQK